jgi:hypothetical protein
MPGTISLSMSQQFKRSTPAHDGRPARVIMEMGQSQTSPVQPPEQSQPGIIEDSIRGFGGGLIRGAAGTVGLVTDTIPGFIADKANWLEGKIRGETPEQSQDRVAERRADLRQLSPAIADAAQTVGKHLSTRGLQSDIESVTGPAYVPQTRAGKFASTAGEFVPGAMIGGPTNLARNVVAYGIVPGLVSEGAGQAFEGSAMETPARIAGGLVGGLGSAAAMKSGVASNMVRNAAKGVTAAELDAAEQLFQQARQHGIDISRAEALQSVTQGGGAKFAAILRGNPQQAANLEAAVRALPNGDQIWSGFNRFLEVMEAQQFRQATGSRTAFKIPGVEDLKSGGLANNTAQIIATGGFKWPQKAMQAIQNWNVGRNLDELARLLS